MFFLESVLAHRDDENQHDYRERNDIINIVKRHVEIFFECRDVLDRKDSRVDRGKSYRAAELDQIDEKRESDRSQNRKEHALVVDDLSHFFEKFGFHFVGDHQADTFFEEEKLLHVDESHYERNNTESDRDVGRHSHKGENIEPRRHEKEVDDARRKNENRSYHYDFFPVFRRDKKGEKEHQNPHRAGIHAVQKADYEGETRKFDKLRVDLSQNRHVDHVFLALLALLAARFAVCLVHLDHFADERVVMP